MGSEDATTMAQPPQAKRTHHVWPPWFAGLSNYRRPSPWIASWQLANTLIPYALLWLLMIVTIRNGEPYWVTLGVAVVAAAFLVRIFTLFHDCVHGSFFAQKGLNTFFGYLLGVLVMTPFEDWRFSHLRHHGSYANLDSRGFGDIWTLTRREFEAASKAKRLCYRLFRNPLVMFGLGAVFSFLLQYRLPTRTAKRKEWVSAIFTNLLILGIVLIAVHTIGWRTYLMIQLPVIIMAGTAGVWLFYVQHQFETVYWARKQEWNPLRAAMEGSSYYKLPALLQWFSSNIGYHHVHHLNAHIPNYRLRACCEATPALRDKPPLTVRESLKCLRLKVWDEERKALIEFPS